MDSDFGGTEILAPLVDIFRQPVASGMRRQICVLTDGQVRALCMTVRG
jgi:hypothetical protein